MSSKSDNDAWTAWTDKNGELQPCGDWPHIFDGSADPAPTAADIRRGAPRNRK
jgi:hypothetical protein